MILSWLKSCVFVKNVGSMSDIFSRHFSYLRCVGCHLWNVTI